MTIDRRRLRASLKALMRSGSAADITRRLSHTSAPSALKMPSGSAISAAVVDERWRVLSAPGAQREQLLDADSAGRAACYARNIENFIGTVKVPVGIAGPIRVNGAHAHGDFYVPLATTEAALVASYGRGARLITEAGGCTAITVSECVSRAPGFEFDSLRDAGTFIAWVLGELPRLKRVADSTTRFGRFRDLRVSLEGNHVFLICDFTSGDASGQNMVTIATSAICDFIAQHSPVRPRHAYLESNHSGDKKASAQSFVAGRGRSVTAEVRIPRALVESHLHTTVEEMAKGWSLSAIGCALSGTIGTQGHYANALAAIFVACGQDVACVAESSVGVTRIEAADGDLYASVTLPNLMVGTVGGGTGLPSQRACLDILGLAGDGHANAFAEVCAAIALAGEISLGGAMCAGHFASAHQRLARGVTTPARRRTAHA